MIYTSHETFIGGGHLPDVPFHTPEKKRVCQALILSQIVNNVNNCKQCKQSIVYITIHCVSIHYAHYKQCKQ